MSIESDFGGPVNYIEHIYDFKKVGWFKPRYYVFYTQHHLATETFEQHPVMFKVREKDFNTKDPKKIFKIYEKIGVINKVTKMV